MGNVHLTTEKFNQLQWKHNYLTKEQISKLHTTEQIVKLGEILFDYQKIMMNGDYLTCQNILRMLLHFEI